MFWFGLTIFFVVLASVGWFVVPKLGIEVPSVKRTRTRNTNFNEFGRRVTDEVEEDLTPPEKPKHGPYKLHGRIAAGAVMILWLIVTVAMSVEPVNAGEVGVVRQFGSIVSQVDEGVNIVAPWQDVDIVNIRTQRHTFGSVEDPITAASSETQDVYVIATINYSVSATEVQNLIRNVGANWFDILVPTRVNQYIKQETAKYETAEIIPNREVIRQAILKRLQNDLGVNYSITISDLLLDNISFSPAYTEAIEQKQVATEQAQAEANRTETVRAEAEQARVRAQGAADAVEIAAQGQADANDLINASLSPELLQWQAIQELGDNVEIALIPSGEGIIIDPTTLFGEPAPEPE